MGCLATKQGPKPTEPDQDDTVSWHDGDGVTFTCRILDGILQVDRDGGGFSKTPSSDFDDLLSRVPEGKQAALKKLLEKVKATEEISPSAVTMSEMPVAKEDGEWMVNGQKTALVEFAANGDMIISRAEEGADHWDLKTDEFGQVAVVVDLRMLPGFSPLPDRNLRWLAESISSIGMQKVTVFLLMASTTSDAQALLALEASMYALGFLAMIFKKASSEEEYQEFTREVAAEDFKKICMVRVDDYFSSSPYDMLATMMETGKCVYPEEEHAAMLGLVEDCEGELDGSCRWDIAAASLTAWSNYAIGAGLEPLIAMQPKALLQALLGKPKLARLPGAVGKNRHIALQYTSGRPRFFVFSDESLKQCSESGIADVVQLSEEGENEAVEAVKLLSKDPVFIVDVKDLAWTAPKSQCWPNRFRELIGENHYDSIPTLAIMAASIEEFSFSSNKFLFFTLRHAMSFDYIANVVFVTYSELPALPAFFANAKFDTQSVSKALNLQMIPFPRLRFFTLGTALGQEIQNGEIILPALTVGPAEKSILDVAKFRSLGKMTPLMVTGPDFVPRVHRELPGQEGSEPVTLIAPHQLIIRIVKATLPDLEAYKSVGSLLGEEWDNSSLSMPEIEEAVMDVQDFITEYEQYATFDPGRVDEQNDNEEPKDTE